MAKFDPSKPHGLVCGELDGRHYEQGGKFFRSNGDPWSEGEAVRVAADGSDTDSDADVTQTPEFKAAVAAALAKQAAEFKASLDRAVADELANQAAEKVAATEAVQDEAKAPASKTIGKQPDRLGPTDKNLKG